MERDIFRAIDLGNAYYQVELSKVAVQDCSRPRNISKDDDKSIARLEGKLVYLDDILVYSSGKAEQIRILGKVLEKIGKAGLRVNPEKTRGKILRSCNRQRWS